MHIDIVFDNNVIYFLCYLEKRHVKRGGALYEGKKAN